MLWIHFPHEILYFGLIKTIENCRFDGSPLEITLHFDLYDTKICKSYFIFEVKNDLFTAEKQYQKKGFGEKLILNSEKYCRDQNSNLVRFNSTKEAIRFY